MYKRQVDLNENRNLFVVSVILIAGVGGLTLTFGKVTLTSVACALILGILTNVLCSIKSKKENAPSAPAAGTAEAENAEVTALSDGQTEENVAAPSNEQTEDQ